MKNKYNKPLFTIIFIVICAVMIVVGRYVKLAVNTFNFTNIRGNRITLTMSNTSSYNELKNPLREKYAKLLKGVIDDTREEFNTVIHNVLGAEYATLRENLTNLEREVKKQRDEFLSSAEYVDGKQKLKDIKKKLDEVEDDTIRLDLNKEFNVALNNLSTLNIKFNNVLKQKREEIDAIKQQIKSLLGSKKEELIKEKSVLEESTKKKIAKIIADYNFELRELNDAFSVSLISSELPFDDEFVSNLTATSNFETEYIANENSAKSNVNVELVTLDGLEDVVVLENNSKLKS